MRAEGIDVSHHNGKFTYLGNVDFGFIRTGNGTKEDREYKNNLPEFCKIGRRGSYHYYRTNHEEHPPMEQADLIFELTDGYGFKTLGVDYEVSDYDDNVINAETAIELYGFLLYLAQEAPERKLLLYCNIYAWRDVLLPLAGKETKYGVIDWSIVDVWLPRYGREDDTHILSINGIPVLNTYTIWQHSADGNGKGAEYGVESKDIDLNVFNGTAEEMDDWLDKISVPLDDILETLMKLAIANADNSERIANEVKELETKININTLGVAELAKRLDTLLQGQLELAENGLVYEEWQKGIDEALVGDGGIYERLEDLAYRMDGLQGGHNHPKWFRKWGLVK